jgi:hypothetical protein
VPLLLGVLIPPNDFAVRHDPILRCVFCSRTTVYAVAARFVRHKRAAFLDRRRRGPKPSLEESANKRIERLVEEESPASYGWLRSLASLELQTPRR